MKTQIQKCLKLKYKYKKPNKYEKEKKTPKCSTYIMVYK